MDHSQPSTPPAAEYELRFESLFNRGRGYAFPCDAQGHVDIDRLSERGRNNYFLARAVVGNELAAPTVARMDADRPDTAVAVERSQRS